MRFYPMNFPPYCTNPLCPQHNPEVVKKRRKKKLPTFHKHGTRLTKAFGLVSRSLCTLCKTTCSSQSFSLDFYAKKVINYQDIQDLVVSSTSIRAIGRILSCTPATVLNRCMRLSRQSAAYWNRDPLPGIPIRRPRNRWIWILCV